MAHFVNDIEKELESETNAKEDFLNDLVSGKYLSETYFLKEDTQFIVARKWNSWYPSFFKLDGGCYLIVPNTNHMRKVIVIDPGFRFLQIVREHHNIEPFNISAIIISHLHPDHAAGLMEFATLMNSIGAHCKIYLNTSSYDAFKYYNGSYLRLIEIKENLTLEIQSYKTRENMTEKIFLTTVPAFHRELGNRHNSLSLIFSVKTYKNYGEIENETNFAIVGDTDGNENFMAQYADSFSNLDLIVLHLGSFHHDEDCSVGYKHLYYIGVKNLLKQIKSKRELTKKNGNGDKAIVVLSEFGLELGTEEEIVKQLQPFISSYVWRIPLIFHSKYIELENAEDKTKLSKVLNLYGQLSAGLIGEVANSIRNNRALLNESICSLTLRNIIISNPSNEDEKEVEEFFEELIKRKDEYYAKYQAFPIGGKDFVELIESTKYKNVNVIVDKLNLYEEFFLKNVLENIALTPLGTFEENIVKLKGVIETVFQAFLQTMYSDMKFAYLVTTWKYVYLFCKSIGLLNEKHEHLKDSPQKYHILYGALGLYSMLKFINCINWRDFMEKSQEKNDVSSLIRIGELLNNENEDWCKIFIGDLSSIFSLKKPIRVKDVEMAWQVPSLLENVFDESDGTIKYRLAR